MGKKILLADDSITIQKVIELTFSDEDFDVITVGNGRLALEKLPEVRPDIVLCDIIMPEKDGYEVCEQIKTNPATSHVPVLLLTGAFEPFDQERAARAGYDGSLAKPFEPETLIAKVKDLLARAPVRAAAPPRRRSRAPPVLPPSRPSAAGRGAPAGAALPAAAPRRRPPAPPPARGAQLHPRRAVRTASTSPPSPEPASPPAGHLRPGDGGGVGDAARAAPARALAGGRRVDRDVPRRRPALERASAPPAPSLPRDRGAAPPRREPASARRRSAGAGAGLRAGDRGGAGSRRGTSRLRGGARGGPRLRRDELRACRPDGHHQRHRSCSRRVPRPFLRLPPADDGGATGAFEPARVERRRPLEPAPAPEPEPAPAFEPEPSPAFEPEPVPAFEPEPAPEPAAVRPGARPVPSPAQPRSRGSRRRSPPAPPASPTSTAAAESFADVAAAVAVPAPPPPPPSEAATVSVPVEMVEKIAQRVVAQISEKAVREIAWEVIPDLAEALIKQEIERLKAELQKT